MCLARTLILSVLLLSCAMTNAGAMLAPSEPADARLIAAQSAQDGTAFFAGVALRLAPGWKTYWRHPGDSGIPPRFDWSGSENVKQIEVLYPAPGRFEVAGETLYGYENQVIFPLRLIARDSTRPVQLHLKLEYAVCSTLCVPLSAVLSLTIRSGDPVPSAEAARIAIYKARVPQLLKEAEGVRLSLQSGAKPMLVIDCLVCAAGELPPDLILEAPKDIYAGVPDAEPRKKGWRYLVPLEPAKGASLTQRDWKMIFVGPEGAIEVERHLP